MIDTTTGLPYTGDAPRVSEDASPFTGIPGRSIGRMGKASPDKVYRAPVAPVSYAPMPQYTPGKVPGEPQDMSGSSPPAAYTPLFIAPPAPPAPPPLSTPLFIPPPAQRDPVRFVESEATWIPGVPNIVTGVTAIALGYALYKTFIDVPRENPSRENPNIPSVKTIELRLGEILAHDYGKGTGVTQGAKKIRAAMERHDGHTLREISSILSAHGVEVTRDRNGNAVATYVNMGETYTPTVLYDHGRHGYTVTDYGSWVESYEKRHGRLP